MSSLVACAVLVIGFAAAFFLAPVAILFVTVAEPRTEAKTVGDGGSFCAFSSLVVSSQHVQDKTLPRFGVMRSGKSHIRKV